ncbi:DUF1462 family protein [Marininema halotolerans]|uniref:DUF1462 family protein n=1 Tax=Marininema halotolerans TaxID=1155944 RepID=UPI000B8A2629|nr:DUF1462 family protein [Marininema halotolerans]
MPITLRVYGAEERCASCVNLPSAKETATWLEAALFRRYGEQIQVRYVDINQPYEEEEIVFSKRVIEEDLWYPVVVLQGEIVGEGNPRLKDIQRKLDALGVTVRANGSIPS